MRVSRLIAKVDGALQKLLPVCRGMRLGVGVSGGPDSVALLSALAVLAPRHKLSLVVLHVNHALRPEADQEQRFVETLCQRLEVPCVTTILTPPLARKGIEAWARDERYRFFRSMKERHDLQAVVVAHTADDQAETVLFHLLRGSARRGLAGIPPVREGWIVRPLLGCWHQEVLAYLTAKDLPFLTDSSNADLRYTRNKIRHLLLPLLEREFSPQVRRHLVSLAETLRGEEEWLEELAAKSRRLVQTDAYTLSVAQLTQEPPALRIRILRQWIEQCIAVSNLGLVHFTSLQALSEGRLRGRVEIPGGWWVRRTGDRLLLEKKHSQPDLVESYVYTLAPGQEILIPEDGIRIAMSLSLAWNGSLAQARTLDSWQALFDANAVADEGFIVRNVRPGDRMRLLGARGRKKVYDIFTDRKIPSERRRRLPLVVLGEDIAWVPGQVRGETAKITADTRRVYRLVADCCKPIAGETITMLGCENVLKGHRA